MKKLILLLFSFLFVFSNILKSQVTQQWVAIYNGPGSDWDDAKRLVIDGSGNIYVTGYSLGNGTGYDYCTIKYNSAGVQQWVARYNGPGNAEDRATSIAIDGLGNIYVTGYSTGSGTGFDYCTIKYNSSGVQQWIAIYNGPANDADYASSIIVDASGNVCITGYSKGSGTDYDYCTIKYSSVGSQQWVARYNGPGNYEDKAESIVFDGAGNICVTGGSIGSGTGYDYCTIKYNSAGVQQWITRYNGPNNNYDGAYSIFADGSGNVYVTGQSYGSTTGFDFCTIKYNLAGVQQWVVTYNGPGNSGDYGFVITVDASENVYATGWSTGSGSGYDYCTIKYNSAGAQQWVARYNGPGNDDDKVYSIAVDAFGNVYVTGVSYGSGTGPDYCTIKYNSVGAQQWVARYDGFAVDEAHSIGIEGSTNVYVTGRSGGNYCTIKYTQGVGIKNLSTEIPTSFSLEQNYPNPFNATTNIKFSLPEAQDVKLIVLDLLGREVATVVNERLQVGSYSVDFDASNLTSGVYLYRITTGEFSDIKKMILVK